MILACLLFSALCFGRADVAAPTPATTAQHERGKRRQNTNTRVQPHCYLVTYLHSGNVWGHGSHDGHACTTLTHRSLFCAQVRSSSTALAPLFFFDKRRCYLFGTHARPKRAKPSFAPSLSVAAVVVMTVLPPSPSVCPHQNAFLLTPRFRTTSVLYSSLPHLRTLVGTHP